MSQNKINLPNRGFIRLFRKEALQFVLKWQKKSGSKKWIEPLTDEWICTFETAAAKPDFLLSYYTDRRAGQFYFDILMDPDLAFALLNELCGKWRKLEKSQFGKLKSFIARHPLVKWRQPNGERIGTAKTQDKAGNILVCELQDGEIAKSFEVATGEKIVSDDPIELVIKARKWVTKHALAGEKFAKKTAIPRHNRVERTVAIRSV